MITSEWGTPNMFEDGLNPELLLGGKYGHQIHVWDLQKRKHKQVLDLGAEQQLVFELRPAHESDQRLRLCRSGDLAEGSFLFDLALVQGRARRCGSGRFGR